MRTAELRATDLKHYFEIKQDLAAAIRDGQTAEIAHHIDELEILAMYTDSYRIQRACALAISQARPIAGAVA